MTCTHDMERDTTVGSDGYTSNGADTITAYRCTKCAYRAYAISRVKRVNHVAVTKHRWEAGLPRHPISAKQAAALGIA